jgi:hypothetical protein
MSRLISLSSTTRMRPPSSAFWSWSSRARREETACSIIIDTCVSRSSVTPVRTPAERRMVSSMTTRSFWPAPWIRLRSSTEWSCPEAWASSMSISL